MKAKNFIEEINSLNESISVEEVRGKILKSLDDLMNEIKRLESNIAQEKVKVTGIHTDRDMELYSNKPGMTLDKVKLSYEMYNHMRWLGSTLS